MVGIIHGDLVVYGGVGDGEEREKDYNEALELHGDNSTRR